MTYGWIRKGKEKEVNTTANRTRLNIVGAIQLGSLSDTISEQYKTINVGSIIHFMNKIIEKISQDNQLHLIRDQAGYHIDKTVKYETDKLNINLVYLLDYSPN